MRLESYKIGEYVWARSCHFNGGGAERIARILQVSDGVIKVLFAGQTDGLLIAELGCGCGCSIKHITQDDLPALAAWKLLHENT